MRNAYTALLPICLLSFHANAYDIGTHARITFNAVQQSTIASSATLPSHGLMGGATTMVGKLYFDISAMSTQPSVVRSVYQFDTDNMVPLKLQDGKPDPNVSQYIFGWLMQGAIREDDGDFALGINNPHDDPLGPFNRFCNHFYDPVNNVKLSSVVCATDDLTSSPMWALGVREITVPAGGLVAPMPMSPANQRLTRGGAITSPCSTPARRCGVRLR